jgi:hypothetical protein
MIQRKLEELNAEQGIKIEGIEWLVSKKQVYQDNENEVDIQWTLGRKNEIRYLILSQSKPGKSFCREILLTQGISIGYVSYKTEGGLWEVFRETGSLKTAPREVKTGNIVYYLDDETSDEAVDDDGNTVTRLTWDYYNMEKAQRDIVKSCVHLAIEVWKEPDADYYEAYLGNLIRENAWEIIDKPSVIAYGRETENIWLIAPLFVVSSSFLINIFLKVPFDITFVSICAFAILSCYFIYNTDLIWFFLLLVPIIIPLLICKVSSLVYLIVYVAASYIVCNLWRSGSETKDAKQRIKASCHFTLFALWVASFINYCEYAPSPHSFSQFATAAMVPIIYTAVTFLVLKLTIRDPA